MKFYFTLLMMLSYAILFAQKKSFFSAGLESNAQWYVNDSRTGDFTEKNPFRSNNYLNLNYEFKHFITQIQFEGYAPQSLLNLSPDLNKSFDIATYSLSYQQENFSATLGYFYDQFGSGLIFRAYEDRQLSINNAIYGGLVHFSPINFLKIKGFYGRQRKGFELSKGNLYGINSVFSLTDLLKLSNINLSYEISYVARYQNVLKTNPKFNKTTAALSNGFSFSKNSFYLSTEYVFKQKDALVENKIVFDNRLFSGQALLVNTGFSIKSFSIDGTFRRLENMSFYLNRKQRQNPFNDQLVNYIPSLTKQQDFSLANIYVYQAQPQLSFSPVGKSGEIGYQLDVFYRFKPNSKFGGKYGTQIALNFANWHGLDATYNLSNRTYSSKYLSFGNKYFSDLNIEIRKKWSKKLTTLTTFMSIFYNKELLEDSTGKINASLLLTETSYKFTSKLSTRVKLEYLQTNDDTKSWWATTAEIYLKNLSFYISDLYNYGNTNKIEKIHFYNLGGSITKNNTRLALNYGRQRGGLICVGGVCRFVPRTTGLSINFSTNF